MSQSYSNAGNSGTANPNDAYSSFAAGNAATDSSAGPVVSYVCGECNEKVRLAKGDHIRCNTCGHRVLYKERTKRMVQFEAR